MTIELKQKAQWLENDVETVISLFLSRIGGGDGILLESVDADGRWGRFSLAAGNFLFSAVCRRGLLELRINDQRFKELNRFDGLPYFSGLRKVMASVNIQGDPDMPPFPAITRGLYGYVGYGAAGLLNEDFSAFLPPEESEAIFALPGDLYLFDHNYNQLAKISLLNGQAPKDGRKRFEGLTHLGPISSSFKRPEFLKAAARAKDFTAADGEFQEITLSTCFSASFEGDLFKVYRRLRHVDPSPYMFFLRQPEIDLAFSSPEVLISCDRGRLSLSPTAGSRPRGRDLSEDGLFEEELYTNPREQAQHTLLVDLARRELGRVALAETIKLERFMDVERFSRDMHLASRLSGQLAEGLDAVDIISAVFPSATVSGLPKIKAMRLVAELEPGPRGPYGGALGWLGLDKGSISLDLGLTTRGIWAREGQVFWRAGAHISPHSEPKMKWRESLGRAEVMLQALAPDDDQSLGELLTNGKAEKSGDEQSAGAARRTDGRPASAREAQTLKTPSAIDAPASLPLIMETIASGRDLAQENAAQLFSRLMDGELQPAQAGAFLMGLRAKGETPVEMAEAAAAVLARAVTPPTLPGPVLDVVGTGGDGRNSFNCSSATALIMAGMGHKVVKHGNRSISSRCGSADVLELLGADLDEGPEMVPQRLQERNFAFLFAPKYHPSFKYIMPVRKELGIRTLFNVLGPLVNPARPYHSFLGAHNPGTAALLAGALARMNTGFSAAVHGAGGYDEMTTIGPATVFLVEGEQIRETSVDPARYGFSPASEEELSISGPEEGVAVMRELLAGRGPKAMRDMLILNVAMALYVVRGGQDFDRCLTEAKSGVEDGAGASVLPG